jgi:hypothetical protein
MKLELQKLSVANVGEWVKYNVKKREDEFEHMAETVSIFYGITFDEAMNIHLDDLANCYNKAIKKISKVRELAEPSGSVTIGKQSFTFNKDLTKLTAGKVIDIKKMGEGLMDRPAYLLAVLYEGGDMSRKQKEKLFNEQFPVDEFLAVLAFFLEASESLKSLIFRLMEIRQTELERETNYLTGTSGQTRYTRWQRILIETWTWLRECITALFYFGKSFSLKKRG